MSVVKNYSIPFPRILLDDRIYFTAVNYDEERPKGLSNHDLAVQQALGYAYDYLEKETDMTREEMFGFLTATADAYMGGPASVQALLSIPVPTEYLRKK